MDPIEEQGQVPELPSRGMHRPWLGLASEYLGDCAESS